MNPDGHLDGSADFYREQAIVQTQIIMDYLEKHAVPSLGFLSIHIELLSDYIAAWNRQFEKELM